MSTAVHTQLCRYGHENCRKHGTEVSVIMRPTPSPVVDLLDLFEAVPVVLRAARHRRGLDNTKKAAKAIGLDQHTLFRIERGQEVTMKSLWSVLEWLGPLTRREWDELRGATVPPIPMRREELLTELRIAMKDGTNDRHKIAARVGYERPVSLARRLRNMGERRLANFFDSEQYDSPGADTISLTPRA